MAAALWSAVEPNDGNMYRPGSWPIVLCISASKAGSLLVIWLIPAAPSGRTRCATDIQANMAIPPKAPARTIRLVGMCIPLYPPAYTETRRNGKGGGRGLQPARGFSPAVGFG